ncbi:MAG: NAD(P)H-binding protein [Deltaproteobacteria bacterium]|nr:NAD(P)H-binding protein [Deltaproteobacteria bacterium]
MFIVTGANGQLGRLIVHALAARVSPGQIGVSVRDVAKAADLAALGVRVRHGDFAEPESLGHAFEGARRVLIVSSNARAYGGDSRAQHRAALDAARDAGAERVLYTSHMAASATSAFPPMHDHAATEAMLAGSGMKWTSLRHGFYASSGLAMARQATHDDVITIPADGVVSWTTHGDLAEAAAAILAGEHTFEGPTPPLTGSEALSLADLATIRADTAQTSVRHDVISDAQYRERLAARGLPPHVAAIAYGFFLASRAGEFARVDGELASILGRAPTRVRTLIAPS